MEVYLGVDVGSVTTKFTALNENKELVTSIYLLTQGNPVETDTGEVSRFSAHVFRLSQCAE